MVLEPGATLLHYRLAEKIGEGGMGVVWKALDTALGREVAVKVLPEAFARDPERLARFEREARLLASLNHPNIAAVFGLHQVEMHRFLAMELVGGEDLEKRLQRGFLPVEEALRVALPVAQALEAAHEHGVIHRDLKPANIQVGPDGTIKVLDFGLAKALSGEATVAGTHPSMSPTLTSAGTLAGMILGTAAYMSPEQAKGKAVDRRADVWAFGTVLFEMLAGRRPFEGETTSETLASVIKSEPDWKALPEDLPPALARLLRRCLEKDPARRLRDIGEARVAIEDLLAGRGDEAAPGSAPAASRRPAWATALAAVGIAAVGAGSAWFLRPRPAPETPLHLEAVVSGTQPLFEEEGSGVVLSPDGSRLAFVTWVPGQIPSLQLHVRSLDRLEGEELPGTEFAYDPFFSPDGQWVGFATPQALRKVSVSGGAPLPLCPVKRSRGASWGEKGDIVVAPTPSGGLVLVSVAGGPTRELTRLEKDETSHRWPQFLPGGTKVLFTSYTGVDRNASRIEVVDVASGRRTVVHQGGTYARYAASGHLLFVNNGTLFAAPFDLSRLKITALPTPVLPEVSADEHGGAQYDVARDGTLVYLTGQPEGAKRALAWADLQGRETPMSETRRAYLFVRLSPDGRRAAVVVYQEGNSTIWIHDRERDVQTRLTFDDGVNIYPVWSPDGRDIYYTSIRGGQWTVYRKRSDGSGEDEKIVASDQRRVTYDVSPDGRSLALYGRDGIHIVSLAGDHAETNFFKSQGRERDPKFSPDGRFLAYDSDESGRWEIYVRSFPGPAAKWQVSTEGGEFARWSADGKFLFYKDRSGGVWRVSIMTAGGAFEAGRPQKLFTAKQEFQGDWDVTSDGRHFLLVHDEQAPGPTLNLVRFTFHWFDELQGLLRTTG